MYSCPSHRCVVRETSQSGDGVRLWKVYGLVSFGSWWGKKTQHILVTDADWICSHPCIQMMQRFMLSSALAAHLYSGITGKKMSGGSLHICVCVCVYVMQCFYFPQENGLLLYRILYIIVNGCATRIIVNYFDINQMSNNK